MSLREIKKMEQSKASTNRKCLSFLSRKGVEKKAGSRTFMAEALEARILYSGAPVPVEAPVGPEVIAHERVENIEADNQSVKVDSGVGGIALNPTDTPGTLNSADDEIDQPSHADELTLESLNLIIDAATERWIQTGLNVDQISTLRNIDYQIADLGNGRLAATEDSTILIDLNAAEQGWFVDPTPLEDGEFEIRESLTALRAKDPETFGIDLLSVVMHEQGHILGLDHVETTINESDLMNQDFSVGERKLPELDQARGAVSGSLEGIRFATLPVVAVDATLISIEDGDEATNTGTFSHPDGKAVTIEVVFTQQGEDGPYDIVTGTVTQDNANGTWSWSYTPFPNEADKDLKVIATDSDGEVTTTNFRLQIVNELPIITVNNTTVIVDEDTEATNSGTFSDDIPHSLYITASVGNVIRNDADNTWSWSYTPTVHSGPEAVIITVTDSDGATATTSFDLTVNNVAPTISHSTSVYGYEGGTVEVTDYFTDSQPDTLTFSASVGTITRISTDQYTWSYEVLDGPIASQAVTLTVTNAEGLTGSTTFELHAINVGPVSGDLSFDVGEDTVGTFNLLSDASDPGGVNEAIFVSADGLTFDGVTYSKLTAQGGLVTIQLVTGEATYYPLENFAGLDSFEIRIEDKDGGISVPVSVGIVVHELPDTPVANPDFNMVYEGTVYTGELGIVGNLMVNDTDSDPDDDPSLGKRAYVVGVTPGDSPSNLGYGIYIGGVNTLVLGSYGELHVNSDGTYGYLLSAQLADHLNVGDVVTDVFTYTISDTQQNRAYSTLTITIHGRNDAPVANNDTDYFFLGIDSIISGNALTGINDQDGARADTDVDGTIITVTTLSFEGTAYSGSGSRTESTLVKNGAFGTLLITEEGEYVYRPIDDAINSIKPGEIKIEIFRYTIVDEYGGTASATVRIALESKIISITPSEVTSYTIYLKSRDLDQTETTLPSNWDSSEISAANNSYNNSAETIVLGKEENSSHVLELINNNWVLRAKDGEFGQFERGGRIELNFVRLTSEATYNDGTIKLKNTARAGVSAGANARLTTPYSFDANGVLVAPGIKIEVEVRAGLEDSASANFSDKDGNGVSRKASVGGSVVAEGSAGASASGGQDGVSGTAKAFAGVKATGKVAGSIAGVGGGLKGEAWAGAGAEATVEFLIEDGKLKINGKLGAAIGAGGAVGVEVTVDANELGKAIVDSLTEEEKKSFIDTFLPGISEFLR